MGERRISAPFHTFAKISPLRRCVCKVEEELGGKEGGGWHSEDPGQGGGANKRPPTCETSFSFPSENVAFNCKQNRRSSSRKKGEGTWFGLVLLQAHVSKNV